MELREVDMYFYWREIDYREVDGCIYGSWGFGFIIDCRYLYVGSMGDKVIFVCK